MGQTDRPTPDRKSRPASQDDQRERRSQQGDPEGPHSSHGLETEAGRPTDKASSQGMADHDFHEDVARRATAADVDNDEPVNTGGRPGTDNTD